MDYSVVIPVHNEEPNLQLLYERLMKTLSSLSCSYEMVFVDDGSKDQSASVIGVLHGKDPRVKLLRLSRNFGQQLAIRAGLDHASGQIVIIMDADLQDPPEVIPRLLSKLEEGYDVAVASRGPSRDKAWTYRIASRAARRIIGWSSLVELPTQGGVFRAMSRTSVEALRQCKEKFGSLNSLTGWIGFSAAEVPIERSPRYKGRTKYRLSDYIDFTFSALLGFSLIPWRYVAGAGCILFAIGSITLLLCLCLWLVCTGVATTGTLIIGTVLFVGGIQLAIMGILGESIARVHMETVPRPSYVVSESLGLQMRPDEHPMNQTREAHNQ